MNDACLIKFAALFIAERVVINVFSEVRCSGKTDKTGDTFLAPEGQENFEPATEGRSNDDLRSQIGTSACAMRMPTRQFHRRIENERSR